MEEDLWHWNHIHYETALVLIKSDSLMAHKMINV